MANNPLPIPSPKPPTPLFKIGDVVRVKALKDSPDMLVLLVHQGHSTCFWFSKQHEPCEKMFRDSQLEAVKPAGAKSTKKGK